LGNLSRLANDHKNGNFNCLRRIFNHPQIDQLIRELLSSLWLEPGIFTGDGIEGRALRNEDKWACALERLHNTVYGADAWEIASRESSIKDFIEAVRPNVFTPPGSPFDRHSIVVFPLNMNNPGSDLRPLEAHRVVKKS
jgi:hypothetical protein